MKLLGIVWLVLNSKFSFGALTFDDLVVDKSWVPVVDSTRRNSVPNDDVLKLEGNNFIWIFLLIFLV